MQFGRVLLIFVFFFISIWCDDSDTACIDGIQTDVAEFTFAGGTPADYWGNICTNKLGVRSIWAAAKVYCTQQEIDAGYKMLDDYCFEYGFVHLVPYSEVLPVLTDDFIASLPVVEFDDIDLAKIWNTSVFISRSFYEAGRKTTTVFSHEVELHKRYGMAVYGFWGGVLLIGIVNRIITHFFSRCRIAVEDSESVTPQSRPQKRSFGLFAIWRSAYNWLRTNLIIPTAFGSHHQRLLWGCTIPTRIETVVVLSFWILNLVLCCVSYEIFWPNLYYPSEDQKWRYISDRTGVMAYANLAVIWMFSGRNNIFLWLTGWNFSTFNIYHRHVARIATVEAIVHSIGYSILVTHEQDFAKSWTEKYWYMGGMATVTMSLILVFSSIILRKRCYEVFLIIHIVFSVITIVGLFYHTEIFLGEYDGYLWPLVAIWVFDRVARFVRVAYCNIHVKLSSLSMSVSETTATYLPDADLIRLEVFSGSRILKVTAGQHFFLYRPMKWKGWENHPFTLAGWTVCEDSPETIHDIKPNSEHHTKSACEEAQIVPLDSPSDNSSLMQSRSSDQHLANVNMKQRQHRLTFLVRPHSSWTKRLRDECVKSPSGCVNAKVLIEGPYSERSPLHTFENVVFIVGGTGISGALPYLQEHVARTALRPDQASESLTTLTRSIKLVWATKQSAMIQDVATRELHPLLGRDDFQIDFHATSKNETSAEQVQADANKLHRSSPTVDISYGRPNVAETIFSAINGIEATGNVGDKIAILTCGPASMADEARTAVHQALKQGKQTIAYFEETFGW